MNEVLLAFLSQYIPETYRDEILAEIQSSGTVSPETLAKAGIKKKSTVNFITSQIKELAPVNSLQDLSRHQLGNILGTETPGMTVDEAALTDEGLKSRQSVYEQLGKHTEALGGHAGELQDIFKQKLLAYGIDTNTDALANRLSEIVRQNGGYPGSEQVRQTLGRAAEDPKMLNFLYDQNAFNDITNSINNLSKAPDTSDDISRIEDYLASRKEGNKREADINSFINDIPNQLAGPRNERISALRDIGNRQFDVMAPQLLERENALGRLNSGAAGDVLSSAYGDIQSNIEAESARLASEDDSFYFNAAYQNKIRQLMEGRTDLASSLNLERQNVRGQQEQRFQTGQTGLNNSLQNDLMMQKYEQQIKAAQATAQRMREMQNNARSAGTKGAIGSLAGTVAGGVAGGILAAPTGGLSVAAGVGLGASLGSGAGAGLPLLFGNQR